TGGKQTIADQPSMPPSERSHRTQERRLRWTRIWRRLSHEEYWSAEEVESSSETNGASRRSWKTAGFQHPLGQRTDRGAERETPRRLFPSRCLSVCTSRVGAEYSATGTAECVTITHPLRLANYGTSLSTPPHFAPLRTPPTPTN